jgi:hypothetical protein
MSEFNGLDQELELEEQNNIVEIQPKTKRKMFYEWEVDGVSYKLKLQTSVICKLEEKFGCNLLDVISKDGIPPLTHMLTIAQGAMAPWNHKMKYSDVQKLFDRYTEEGGDQLSFFSNVIMGTMAVSGFFTQSQAEELTEKMKQAELMM